MSQVESLFALAREFAQDRRARELGAQSALDAYCKAHPELLAARAQVARARVMAARSAMSGKPHSAQDAEAAFDALLAQTLKEEGLPADHFAFKPRCVICQDTGVVGEDSQKFCSCLRQEYAARLKTAGGVDLSATFAAWDAACFSDIAGENGRSERQYMERFKAFLMDWCEHFTLGISRGLRLVGGTGCGKTFALNCAANALCDAGYSAIISRAYELNRMAAATFSADWQKPYLACDLLLIDDLGAEPMYRKITAELFFSLVESRRCAGKPTIVATNLTDAEIEERYGSRLYSRLIDQNTTLSFHLPAHDLRLDKR